MPHVFHPSWHVPPLRVRFVDLLSKLSLESDFPSTVQPNNLLDLPSCILIYYRVRCLATNMAYLVCCVIALPPSPLESPSRCDTPSIRPADIRLPESPVIPSSPAADKVPEKHIVDDAQPAPSSCSTKDANVPLATANCEPVAVKPTLPLETAEEQNEGLGRRETTTPQVAQVTFAQFARQFHLEKHQGVRKANLLHRLRTLRVSLGISTRLLRVGSTIQKGLVESFKQGDKSSFVSLYNSILDMREACDAASRRSIHGHDPLICSSSDLERDLCSHFVQRLTQRSKEDLLEILTLVRTDSQFLFRCIVQLTPSQLSALVSPVHTLDLHDSGLSRTRAQPLFSKRTTPHYIAFKDHVFALERTDSLSALVLNAFADPLDSNGPEATLRLKVWSSTCAKLVAYGGSGHYSFVGHLVSFWAGAREWKVKAKFELYLMDVLQSGAYLLEQPDIRPPGSDAQYTDPLRTDVAEVFFQSSVSTLFGILDDQDSGGLPAGALEFGNAVLSHLNVVESRNRFLEYIFLHWFFGKFLHTAIMYPEVRNSHPVLPSMATCGCGFPTYFSNFSLSVYCLTFTSPKMLENASYVRFLFVLRPRYPTSCAPCELYAFPSVSLVNL